MEKLRGTWACVLLACGAPNPMTPSPPPPTGAHTAAASPRLRLVVHNFAADEGETWTFDVRADGSFAAEGWMSNGGEDHTAWRCEGAIEAALAGTWLGRLDTSATLARPPPLDARGAALERGQTLGFELGYLRADGTTTYVDPAPWFDDVKALHERLAAGKRCATVTAGR